jgi:hypothetical protein
MGNFRLQSVEIEQNKIEQTQDRSSLISAERVKRGYETGRGSEEDEDFCKKPH